MTATTRLTNVRRSWWRVMSRLRARALAAPDAWSARAVPAPLRRRLRLDGRPAGARRVEIGSGYSPRPGYLHVDAVAWTSAIDLVSPADAIPLPAGWADEVLTVHMIEHLPPPSIMATLRHWYDLLAPGGVLTVHTPNGASLGRVLADASESPGAYWPAISALYGYNRNPDDVKGPDALAEVPDHRLVFTAPILMSMLAAAGFDGVEDVSGHDADCHHTIDWAPHVTDLCLEVRAQKPLAPT